MKTNKKGLDFIKEKEGLRLQAYQDDADVWTIGYGHTGGVKRGDKITQAQADAFLAKDVERFEAHVTKSITQEATDNEFSAMVSLTYNIGEGGFSKSTVLREFNAGNKAEASQAFARWNKITDPDTKQLVASAGLTRRRENEAQLFQERTTAHLSLPDPAPERVTRTFQPSTPEAPAPEQVAAAEPVPDTKPKSQKDLSNLWASIFKKAPEASQKATPEGELTPSEKQWTKL